MNLTKLILMLCALMGAPMLLPAQGAAPPEKSSAIDFLRRVEARNAETSSLEATFSQRREDSLFGDVVESRGQFWYRSPDSFRASYRSDHGSDIWIQDGKITTYLPDLKQVEIYAQDTGEGAPINQLLLGFGIQVEKILEIFHVTEEPRAAQEGERAILFVSKDLRRSLEFEEITIVFDEEQVEPVRLVLRNDDSILTIELEKVSFNAKIADKTFEARWPKDAEVLDYTREAPGRGGR